MLQALVKVLHPWGDGGPAITLSSMP
jgi:hypothetical protein